MEIHRNMEKVIKKKTGEVGILARLFGDL